MGKLKGHATRRRSGESRKERMDWEGAGAAGGMERAAEGENRESGEERGERGE
jgi:hypothetical protein